MPARTSHARKAKRKNAAKPRGRNSRWSGRVMRESSVLNLESGVFTWSNPKCIASSLKRSAEESRHRKADPYRSALSMLVFYINRAGKSLPKPQKRILQLAKGELRKLFHRPDLA